MSKKTDSHSFNRRQFLKLAGGSAALAAASGFIPKPVRGLLSPINIAEAALANQPADLSWIGTDGWISLPTGAGDANLAPYFPDNYAPANLNAYIFGFRNVTGLTQTQVLGQKMKAQATAPLFWLDEFDPSAPYDFAIELTNLGLQIRPDLTDAHTLHWHGFRNVIPYFDGEPVGSISVPPSRIFRYIYRPRDPGTYMYHCHVEDVEHVHMGMTGMVFVRPLQNKYGVGAGAAVAPVARSAGGTTAGAPLGYAYNDGVALNDASSTAYDREFTILLTEFWAYAHWCDSHIQLPDWTDYKADFGLINGRAYPDTVAPNSPFDMPDPNNANAYLKSKNAIAYKRDANGDLLAPVGHEHLKYQPLSSLIECNEGERVLIRFVNLGFTKASMTLPGIKMRVVGKDATPMKGRDGTDTSYETNTINFGAGEAVDAIFTAPAVGTYPLYNREYEFANNKNGGHGGQRTEVRVSAAGALAPQTVPNQLFNAV
jgi:FtsP/CotA-like multicopper oxidase with cupredoxin domain